MRASKEELTRRTISTKQNDGCVPIIILEIYCTKSICALLAAQRVAVAHWADGKRKTYQYRIVQQKNCEDSNLRLNCLPAYFHYIIALY